MAVMLLGFPCLSQRDELVNGKPWERVSGLAQSPPDAIHKFGGILPLVPKQR